jgi:AraC-like DNA-binding protein
MSVVDIRFSLFELVSFLGLAQCIFVLVYMIFRAGRISRATLPFLYFLFLGTAFFVDFSGHFIGTFSVYYPYVQWGIWLASPPLSVLLIIQIARITKVPEAGQYSILLLLPIAVWVSYFFSYDDQSCYFPESCDLFISWLTLTGLITGGMSLLILWSMRGLLDEARNHKIAGKERFWMIIALIIANISFLAIYLAYLSAAISYESTILARSVLGITLVYLASTSLFRIYPQAVRLSGLNEKDDFLSDEELEIAFKIEKLIDFDKVYQEPSYSRADLAKELDISEAVLSRVINLHFKKSFPQLLNENRVRDAKQLLRDTYAPVKTVAEEAGFNSIASFNRVFKDIEGESPSSYRKNA